MIYLLIGGAPHTGKTETVYDIAGMLIDRCRYNVVLGEFKYPKPVLPEKVKDFICILEGNNPRGLKRKVLINSASDIPYHARRVKKWKDKASDLDIIIIAIRDNGDPMRQQFLDILEIGEHDDHIVEVPLAKINRHEKKIPLDWYKESMFTLIQNLMRVSPLEL